MRLWKIGLVGLGAALFLGPPVQADQFEHALPGRVFSFPRDHFSHPEFRTEWWYYTGHLYPRDGRSYGYQLTFFRSALRRETLEKSRWAASTLYFGHFALTDENKKVFRFRERISRGALGQAGARTDRLEVWIDDWRVTMEGSDHVLVARDPSMAIRLRLTPSKGPIIHGIDGVSQKAEGEGYASHYYSMTRMRTQGELTVDGEVLTADGLSWMDHEFMSNQLRDTQVGWDWFSIQLDHNTELMLYVIRHQDGRPDPYSSGTLIYPDGSSRHLRLKEFEIHVLGTWKSKATATSYPARWRIHAPHSDIDLMLNPTVPDQELTTQESTQITYWEGSVTVNGTYGGKPVVGVGYVELTGYAQPFEDMATRIAE